MTRTQSFDQPRVVLAACMVQFVVIGLLISFGVFFKELESEFGWSRTLISTSSALAFLLMGVLAIFAGQLNDRFGPRIVLGVSGIMCGIGYFLMAHMSEPWHLFVIFGLFVSIGLSTHDVVTLSTVARWFPGKRGLMTGVVKSGTAIGQIVVPILSASLIVKLGWQGALEVLGVAAIVLLTLAAFMIVNPPDPNQTGAAKAVSDQSNGLSFSEAKTTRSLWLMCTMQLLFFPTLMGLPLHIVVHGQDLGMTPAMAATLLSTMGAASIAGRLFIGQMVDKIGGKLGYILCLLPLIASLSAFLVVESFLWLFVAMTVYGIAHGGLFTVVSPAVADYFGLKAHGAIFGLILFFGTLGGSVGPIAAGWIFDTTGSYFWAFALLDALAIIALSMALLLPRTEATPAIMLNTK